MHVTLMRKKVGKLGIVGVSTSTATTIGIVGYWFSKAHRKTEWGKEYGEFKRELGKAKKDGKLDGKDTELVNRYIELQHEKNDIGMHAVKDGAITAGSTLILIALIILLHKGWGRLKVRIAADERRASEEVELERREWRAFHKLMRRIREAAERAGNRRTDTWQPTEADSTPSLLILEGRAQDIEARERIKARPNEPRAKLFEMLYSRLGGSTRDVIDVLIEGVPSEIIDGITTLTSLQKLLESRRGEIEEPLFKRGIRLTEVLAKLVHTVPTEEIDRKTADDAVGEIERELKTISRQQEMLLMLRRRSGMKPRDFANQLREAGFDTRNNGTRGHSTVYYRDEPLRGADGRCVQIPGIHGNYTIIATTINRVVNDCIAALNKRRQELRNGHQTGTEN
ncbi:hypothetical protein HYT84_02270 [Candidatus Micrarchaeota archaeon]|nr:hypothetical protein [Candidatus Micrarchaeota archaeon]